MQRPPLRSTKPSGESKSSLLAKAYQDDDAAYTMVKPRKNVKAKRVIDLVEVDDNSYVRYKGKIRHFWSHLGSPMDNYTPAIDKNR